MALRGKKPTPTHLRLVKGNPGKRPLPKNEPKPDLVVPPVPPELSDDAKLEWGRVTVELHKLGLLSGIDRAALAAYCSSYGLLVRVERLLRKIGEDGSDGILLMTAQGNVVQHPLLGVANKARRDMMAYAVEFGMTPSSRSRVNGAPPEKDDPLSEFV